MAGVGGRSASRSRFPVRAGERGQRAWHHALVRGADAMELIVERIAADIRLAFPDVVVRFVDDGELEVRTTEWRGAVGTNLDEDDDMTPVEVEDALAAVTEDVANNLWPDDSTDPWPLCPAHSGHPLNPRVVRGAACWVCSRDDGVAVRIGSLHSQ